MAHVPREVLSESFGIAEPAWKNLPRRELFIFQTAAPGPLEADQKAAAGTQGSRPRISLFAPWRCPQRCARGAETCASSIPASSNPQPILRWQWSPSIPEACAKLHWHPNSDEWQYYIAGKGRMTVISTGNVARTMDFQAGDVGYVQQSLLRYIQNTGDTDLVFLEMFKSASIRTCHCSSGWRTHLPNW